jgi:hypothetical protein
MQPRRFFALLGIFAIVFAAKFVNDVLQRTNPIPTEEEQAIIDRANKASEVMQKTAVEQNLRPTPPSGTRPLAAPAGHAIDSSGRTVAVERADTPTGCNLVMRIANEAITIDEIVSVSVGGQAVAVERFPGTNDVAITCGVPGSEGRFVRRSRRGSESEFSFRQP